MSINRTLNYLLAKQAEICLNFSGQVSSSSTYLKGAGGEAGDGFPLPKEARIYRIDCWDGTILKSDTGNVSADQSDRLSVYAAFNVSTFDVSIRINGVDTVLIASGLASGSTLMVTVYLKLI